MTSLLFGFVGGLVGWFASSFLGEPLMTLLGARRKAQSALYFYRNVLRDDSERCEEASEHFRGIAPEIEGLKCSLLAPAFREWGFDLNVAVQSLTSYSNSICEIGFNKISTRVNVQKALRLPVVPEDLQALETLGPAK